ncbi:MAG: 6-hydroxymethylpterin diphosphokinase MptE-like protein [Solibacillus sp.]
MLVDNRTIIKQLNLSLYNQLVSIEEGKQAFKIEPAKKEGFTLSIIQDDTPMYVTSKYNAINEANTFLEKYSQLKNPQHFLFIGVALGQHIIELLNRFPKATYSIYEPNIHILSAFLSHQNLSRIKSKLTHIFTDQNQIEGFDEFIEKYVSKGQIIIWPMTQKIDSVEVLKLEQAIAENLKNQHESLSVRASHQQRWQTNAIINFNKLITTPHIFDMDLSALEGKPVIIIAAGPSLSVDLDLIKQIQEKKKAYLLAVGSAVNSLIEYGITPDLFVSFDPQIVNQNILAKVKEKNTPIPLLFGSTIGFETLPNYPGPMFHFFVAQETISRYFLDIAPQNILNDKTSVAVMTLEICARLKMGPIILAGQNCAYLDNRRYASGIEYAHISSEVTESEQQKQQQIESVDGEMIYTNNTYNLVRVDLETNIKRYDLKNVFNTTKRGAKIEGAPYIPLEELLQTNLIKDNVVTFKWEVAESNYNRVAILQRYEALEKDCEELIIAMNHVNDVMTEIVKRYKSKMYKNLNPLLIQFDRYFDEIHANTFYTVVIEPMMRVQKEKFQLSSREVRTAHSEKIKIEKFIQIFIPYMKAIFANVIYVQEAFKEMKKIKEHK